MAMTLELPSPCKVNLLLNILGRRADGFHELETVLLPVAVFDQLSFSRSGRAVELTCSHPGLPTDGRNLVHRAAERFRDAARIADGIRIHLEKRIPMEAGLGGGSANAATTLLGLNEVFGRPLGPDQLQAIAAGLGSDIPFFLQPGPALATGRGERIEPLAAFPALRGGGLLLAHPGFGVSTAWAYQQLARFPAALHGRAGRARELIASLQAPNPAAAADGLYNAFEAPVLKKYPLLAVFQEFLRAEGAAAALMSGSGSTTFALTDGLAGAQALADKFSARFGPTHWVKAVPL
jgi:4-diphosphocytidyl-2-C-methyl-D-erythritol kinase